MVEGHRHEPDLASNRFGSHDRRFSGCRRDRPGAGEHAVRRQLDRADHHPTRRLRSQFEFGVEIRDGIVSGSGGIPVSGRVARNGSVSVGVASRNRNANGSGRLSASSGGGAWRGVGSQGACSGRWSASRR